MNTTILARAIQKAIQDNIQVKTNKNIPAVDELRLDTQIQGDIERVLESFRQGILQEVEQMIKDSGR